MIAKLTEQEKNDINKINGAIQSHEIQLQLMQLGRQTIWKTLAEKYKLPVHFDYDMNTGEILEVKTNE